MAGEPRDKANASDKIEGEVIKGTQDPTEAPSLQEGARTGDPGGRNQMQERGGATQAGLEAGSGSRSGSGSSAGLSTDSSGNTITDPDIAMHRLRGDVDNLHQIIADATHRSTVPFGEVGKLLARCTALVAVIRG